ncbi:hypothetical protein KKG81_14155, partial [bacterium]|nr:hypothetical protein [bacterium]
MTKIDSINYSKSPVNLIGNIILNKNIISSENISTIDLNVINFKDYIFHSLILNFAKVKYKNYDFKLFIEKYKFLLDHNNINPHFKEILNNLFKFIQRIFLNHQYNDLINFKFRDINHNLNLMKEYDNYLKNSLDITLKELEKE